jgi:hypothetical protein
VPWPSQLRQNGTVGAIAGAGRLAAYNHLPLYLLADEYLANSWHHSCIKKSEFLKHKPILLWQKY